MKIELNLDAFPKSVNLGRDGEGLWFDFVDQRLLPEELKVVRTRDWRVVVQAIQELGVRGAPAIGLAGAASFALWCAYDWSQGELDDTARAIATARPTAVNLSWAVKRVYGATKSACARGARGEATLVPMLFDLVKEMEEENERCNRAIGALGAKLLAPDARVLTHCNAGSLATGYFGTALGVVYAAAEHAGIQRVYADETRPVCQGARLTAWELAQVGIPVTLICDDMAASLMASGAVDAVVVGADRIAGNGDVANKIGTYGLAVIAHEHGVPFYVAAPTSTIDASLEDGSHIVIEQRDPAEVLAHPIAGVDVWNPAFDVTPARYITRIITEKGVFAPEQVAR